MLIVKKYKDSGLNDDNLNQLATYYIDKVKDDLSKKSNFLSYFYAFFHIFLDFFLYSSVLGPAQ